MTLPPGSGDGRGARGLRGGADGAGQALKLLQRERALAMDLDLIEWTYDPMQAMNAHLNFAKLGVVVGLADYRVRKHHDVMLDKCAEDARSAVRWLAASSVSYSGSVTDSRPSLIRGPTLCADRGRVNVPHPRRG